MKSLPLLALLLLASPALAQHGNPHAPKMQGVSTAEIPAAQAEPTGPAPDPKVASDAAIKLIEALSAATVKHTGNCDAMGEAMVSVVEHHTDTVKMLAAAKKGGPAGKYLQEHYGERAAKAMMAMMTPLNGCHSNSKVRLALGKL